MFSINNRLIIQVDGCPMGGSISVKVFMDKDFIDKLFIDLNSYHENIKLTLETNPNKFLDT